MLFQMHQKTELFPAQTYINKIVFYSEIKSRLDINVFSDSRSASRHILMVHGPTGHYWGTLKRIIANDYRFRHTFIAIWMKCTTLARLDA